MTWFSSSPVNPPLPPSEYLDLGSTDATNELTAERRQEFRLKEYDSLRQEVAARSQEQFEVEKQVALGCSAIYGVIGAVFTSSEYQSFQFIAFVLWWVPTAIVYFGYMRWRANGSVIAIIGSYLQRIEGHFIVLGWEHFLRQQSQHRGYWIRISWLWGASLVATIVVAVFGTGLTADVMFTPTFSGF